MSIRHRIVYAAKWLLAACCYYSGLLHLYKHFRLRDRAVVLLYHRVLDASERPRAHSSDGIVVTREVFERHLRFLQRHFNVVDARTFGRHLQTREKFPPATCLITFDDGWSDNFKHAFPALKERGLPAVIFLPTDYIGSGRVFWQERMARLLNALRRSPEKPASGSQTTIEKYGLRPMLDAPETDAPSRIHEFIQSLKSRSPEEIEKILGAITACVPSKTEMNSIDTYMNWTEIREMAQNNVIFGSHAVSHCLLTQLDPPGILRELRQSRDIIERELNGPITMLAYPNGNYDERVIDCAGSAGYEVAFTTRPGLVSTNTDRLAIPRLNIHDGSTRHNSMFLATVLNIGL